MQTKRVGLVGGIGPESTLDYYRLLVASYRERTRSARPLIIIDSVDLERVMTHLRAGALDDLADYFLESLQRLRNADCDFAALTSVTAHITYGRLRDRAPLPLISIVDVTREAVLARGMRRVGLIGTRFTMESSFIPDGFRGSGVEVSIPSEEERAFIHDAYLNELVNAIFKPQTRERLLQIIATLRECHGIEGVILGGTELPLILRDSAVPGVEIFDPTALHVRAITDRLID